MTSLTKTSTSSVRELSVCCVELDDYQVCHPACRAGEARKVDTSARCPYCVEWISECYCAKCDNCFEVEIDCTCAKDEEIVSAINVCLNILLADTDEEETDSESEPDSSLLCPLCVSECMCMRCDNCFKTEVLCSCIRDEETQVEVVRGVVNATSSKSVKEKSPPPREHKNDLVYWDSVDFIEQNDNIEDIFYFLEEEKRWTSHLYAQASCCRKNCDGPCETQENKQARRERMQEAEKRRKAMALKVEKQRLLKQLEKNKKLRDRAHASLLKKLQAQALDTVFKSATDAITLPTTVTNTLHNVDDSLNSFKDVLDRIISYFNSIGESLLPQGFDLVSIAICLYNIYHAVISKSYVSLSVQFFSLARIVKVDYEHYYSFLTKLIYGEEVQAQAFGPEILPIKMLGAVFITIITMLCGGRGSVYSLAASHLADFGRAAVGWTKMTDLFVWFKDCFLDMYYRCNLGKTLEEIKLEEKYPLLKSALARVSLLKNEPQITRFIDRCEKICKHIIDLDDDLTAIRFAALRAQDSALVGHITGIQLQLKDTFFSARNSAAYSHKNRTAPTTLFVYGKSNVGKSNLMKYIKHAIYMRKYKDDKTWNVHTMCHTRDVINEFWDGYMDGQPIVEYDDMLQSKDSSTKPNAEVLEFIRIKNDAPYHLHMSNVADKKNCYFTSPYVLATCNQRTPKLESIACPEAFLRRWDIAIEVRVNPMWGKNSPDGSYTVIDQDKIAKADCPAFQQEVYLIDRYDISTGNIIEKDMILPKFMEFFWKTSEACLKKSSDLSDSILTQLGMKGEPKETSEAFCEKLEQCLKPQMLITEEGCSQTSLYESPAQFFFSAFDSSDKKAIKDDKLRDFVDDFFEQKGKETKSVKETISDTFEDAKDALDSASDYFLTSVKKVTVAATDSAKEAYEKAMNSKLVTSFVTFVQNKLDAIKSLPKSLAGWFYDFFTSKNWYHLITLCGALLVGGSVFKIGQKLFSNVSCGFADAPNLDQLRVTTCECKFCDSLVTTRYIGSYLYAVEVLLFLIEKDDLSKPVYVSWLREAIEKSSLEVVEKSFDRFEELSQYFSESKESAVRIPKHKLFSESRESAIKTNPFKLRAEALPCNVVDIHGNIVKAQASDLVQLEQWESTTLKNLVLITDSTGGRVNGVFLRGTQLLAPNHFVEQIKSKNGKFYLKALNIASPQEFSLSSCKVKQCTDLSGKRVDLAILTLPNTTPSRPNILPKFAASNQLPLAPEGSAVVSGIRKLGNTPSIFAHHTDKIEAMSRALEYQSNYGTCRINSAIKYDVDTKAGDCGCLVYAKNPAISGKVIGYHLAGHNGIGIAIPLSREFLERNLNGIEALPRQTTDARIPFSAQAKLNEIKLQNSLPQNTLALAGNCLALGMLPKTHTPSKTQIEPSLVAGTLQEPVMKPAHLRPVKVNGEFVDPLIKGIKKIMTVSEPLRPDILKIVVDDVKHIHVGGDSDKRVLSFEEAITGLPHDPLYAPLNRTTSAGYPYNLGAVGPGKRPALGYDDYTFDSELAIELRADVEKLIDQARNNQRGDVVWNATLKDERRMKAKVDEIKTRVFTAGPQHFTIAFRQYFLGFMVHVARNKIDNEIGVGTNVYSMDWHQTALKLQQQGEKVIAGDFSNYDGSLLAEVMWEILDLINEWYDDGPENAQIRQVLFQDICHARILVGEELIQCDHSQPSGNPGTVIFNSLFNQIIMRYAYMLCKEKAGLPLYCDFLDTVSMQTYGDDNVLNISDSVIDWYNQVTISDALATIGMTYTDEAKTGELVKYRSLNEIAYLKRQFKLSENGIYQAPLDIIVCKEMPNWIKNVKGMRKEATFENCLAAIREFYFHGELQFNDARNLLHTALVKKGIRQRLPTYFEMDAFYNSGLFD